MGETFNYEKVAAAMNNIDSQFAQFAENVTEANKLIEENIQIIPDGAVYGDNGMRLRDLWFENSSNFDKFYSVFQSWSNAVAQIGMNNMTLEDFAASIK